MACWVKPLYFQFVGIWNTGQHDLQAGLLNSRLFADRIMIGRFMAGRGEARQQSWQQGMKGKNHDEGSLDHIQAGIEGA